MIGNRKTLLFASAFLCALTASHLQGGIIMQWDASDWSGNTADPWNSSVGGQTLTVGSGSPDKGSETLLGQTIDYVSYAVGGTSERHQITNANHPLVGLQEFSISIVYRTTDNESGA